MLDVLESLYHPDKRDRDVFEKHYAPPPKFQHGTWHRIAVIEKDPGSDGQPAVIQECRMPARFFRVDVLESENSIGEMLPAFSLTTGSEMGQLALDIAKATARGMLGLAGPDD